MNRLITLAAVFCGLLCHDSASAADLKVLFLGDNGHHNPRPRFEQLQPIFAQRGIDVVYTDRVEDLNLPNLRNFDALLLYANIDRIDPPQEQSLLDYVEQGGGFVPLHCASYCFRNSEKVVALIGGQFKSHETGVFRTVITQPGHPIMQGFGGFRSWDETYVHHKHNEQGRTVLSYRDDGTAREPWTWVRRQGEGRVFYTAWGHDERTWASPGFLNLVERGVRWAAGKDPSAAGVYMEERVFDPLPMVKVSDDAAKFEYIDVGGKIPVYEAGKDWGTQGAEQSRMQRPLSPSESRQHLVVPAGFRAELFASEPDIGGKPICMAWDERGRLWVGETVDYPNELQPIGKGRDRIRILEDTDGDYRADKFTVFADKLSIPTSIAFHRGGAIVQNGTQTLYLKDTDGDDVADVRQVMFTGWAQNDTHGGVSNFQYGLDNWIWAMQGYNHSTPQVDGAPRQGFRQGFFRFRPDGSELEFIRSTDNNTWGLGISEEGIVFGSTANRNPSVHMPIPNRYYERVRGWAPQLTLRSIADTHLFAPVTDKVRQVDHHGGYTAGAGHALYTARQYPSQYWNRTAFVNGPTGHLVGTFLLTPSGAGFQSTSPNNLLASDDEWTAPIMSEVGPDGSVWVIDWYNYIIQHNPTPRGFEKGAGNAYETDLRDKKHGRIYRVVYEAPDRPFSLENASPADLVAALKHPNMLWRKHAQRLLIERGDRSVAPRLISLLEDESVDEIGLNVGAMHAIWTMEGLGLLDGSNATATKAVYAALRHPAAGVRRNAIAVLPHSLESTKFVVQSKVLHDRHPQVRLAALLALSDLPGTAQSANLIVEALRSQNNNGDRWLREAAIIAAAGNSQEFLLAAANANEPEPALREALQVVANHYARTKPVDSIQTVMAALASAQPEIAAIVVQGLSAGWPPDARPEINEAMLDNLRQLLTRLSLDGKGPLVKLTSSWDPQAFAQYAEQISASLLAQLDDDSATTAKRLQAANQLVALLPTADFAVEELLDRINPQLEPELAIGSIEALKGSDADKLGKLLAGQMRSMTPRMRVAAVSVLLNRSDSTLSLLDEIDRGAVQLTELSLDQQQALAAHPDRSVRMRARQLLERGGALPSPDRQRVLDELLPVTQTKGDPQAGKLVFAKQCAKCHVHNGEGSQIGPDLTGMSVHPKAELLTHIIDPNRDVEGNYRVYTVMTVDGLILSGLLASESRNAINLFDAEGKRQVVLREDIEELVVSPKSLMPEGFEKQVSTKEIADLLEFLTQRGKFVPLDLRQAATITSSQGMFYSKENLQERLMFEQWTPRTHAGVPFQLLDPQAGSRKNVILLHGPQGDVSREMPQSVRVICNTPAKSIHLLSGISGWGHPLGTLKSVSMIVRIHYADGKTEDHELLNGDHFADYIRRVDVPGSQFAYQLRGGQQVRYLSIQPGRKETIDEIEFIKGKDQTAPMVLAITLETDSAPH